MKKRVKSCKRFISIFLAGIMIYSMAFTGLKVLASSLTITLATYNSSWATQAIISVQVSGNTSIKVTNPDGTKAKGDWYVDSSYTVSANGNYTFTAIDSTGASTSKSITISNIDTTSPNLNLTQSTVNGSTIITATASDSGSGIQTITKPNGNQVWNTTSISYQVSTSGTYTFKATDNVGNTTAQSITIDTTPPNLNLTQSTANGSAVITATASDNNGSGIKSITKPDGTAVSGSTATYTVSTNGTYNFTATDNAGNTTTKGITISSISSTTNVNNGDWNAESVTLQNTGEAQLMVRVGDIDNFGFGWGGINPFSGNETSTHSYPFYPSSSDIDGTDRIMVVSGYSYNSNYKSTGTNRDGYTETTSRDDRNLYYNNYNSTDNDNNVRAIHMTYTLGNISVQNATIQMFVDDFQPMAAHGISGGTVKYTATIAGKDGTKFQVPEISNIINGLDQSGPKGKLITFQIPERYLDLVRTGEIYIKIDDSVTGSTGDGYAIDFVKLLINKTDSTVNTATVTGNVKDTSNNNIPGATVSAGGVVTATTDANGNYTLNNVPAGQAIVTASKTGYNSSTVTIPTVIAGGGYTANFTLTSSTPPTTPVISASPTALTNSKVTATITYSSDSIIKQYRVNIGGVTGEWKIYTGFFDVTQNCIIEAQGINQYGNSSQIANYTVANIDTTAPTITLTQSPTTQTNGTVTITASASDNVAVASITKPDSTVVTGSSTTYTVSANGTYTFTATDTAGNVATQSININNIAITSTNDTSLPNIGASLESVTPNPAKSSDEITIKYDINTSAFSLSSGMINEAVVLVDMSQGMNSNQRFSQVQNGFVNQVINDSNLSGIKLGVVGYNDSVYIGTRSNYSDPKSCVMKQTDESLSNIDKINFLPLYNLNDANTKDGYRQFYQNGYISNNISSNDQRQFGSALKVADKVLTDYGNVGAKKAIVIVSSGNLTYSDAQIESIKGKGYKIIILDISNSDSTNIKDTYMKLCGNEFGINGNYYKGTFNDSANYNSVDADMKKVDESLKGVTNVTALSIKNAKLNIDLGENFKAVNGGGLEGSGKICTVTIPQINFTYNSTIGLWEQSGTIEVTFKVKSESGKYGQLGFGLYTNTDNTTNTKSSTMLYTDFYNIATNKKIETPIINITMDVKIPSAPVIISPTDGTITKNNKPTISGTAEANSTVKVYDDGTTCIGTVTANGIGNWTLTPATGLADGTHAITATATDAAGNVSPVSNTVNIIINTKVPAAPVITTPSNNTVTNSNTPTISGTAEANLTVKVYDGTTLIGTVTTDGTGNWTLTPSTGLADGMHAITAKATDALGNVSPASNTVNITIYEASSILQHGIYSGSSTGIVADKNVTNGIPVTMAIIVDSKSSHPVINWSSDRPKLKVDTTSLKEYDISDDNSTISNLISLGIDDSGNITGLAMQKGKKYLIIYTMTPIANGQVTVNATADKTSNISVNLSIGDQPDLF